MRPSWRASIAPRWAENERLVGGLRVLGIDPGSRIVGFGVVEVREGVIRHVSHGTVRAPTDQTLAVRLATIRSGLEQVLRAQDPSVVVLEGLFYARNVKSVLTLAHARGVALEVAATFELPVMEYSPMEMKRSLVGYGRATKLQVSGMVQRLLGLGALPSPDAGDALALAICHVHADRMKALRSGRSGRGR